MQFPPDFQLFLASQSPRRHSMLADIGVPFTVVGTEAEEQTGGGSVRKLAERNALAKVREARIPEDRSQGAFVLGTDTLVSLGRGVMGKPATAQEAAEMLSDLSGRRHRVVSGVALGRVAAGPGADFSRSVLVRSASTEVVFASLTEDQIAAYVDSQEWRGKAGGYAIQGLAGVFVHAVEGEYSNVVGLPLHLLYGMFRELGFDLMCRSWVKGGHG